MFSKRIDWPGRTNSLARLLAVKKEQGAELIDLTESNPTRVGIGYPVAEITAAFSDEAMARYAPQPRGGQAARHVVAESYRRRGLHADPERIVLTASTSEAYALLFKMLLDPGDAILIPRPSYPLFDYLAALEGLRVVDYRLEFDAGRWRIDQAGLEQAAGGARALALVNPNNPTGSALTPEERGTLDAFCAGRGLPIIADEVFWDYRFEGGAGVVSTLAAIGEPPRRTEALTFTLGGLSKACGLPQMKLGWIVVGGPEGAVAEALDRLEFIADCYLSVGAPVQSAAPRLLDIGDTIRSAIIARITANRAALARALPADSPCRLLPTDGGWYGVLKVPAIAPEEELALQLLERDDVVVHPGYFFDFAREAYLIVSLLPPPDRFEVGIGRILDRVTEISRPDR
jgi:aspartate/methionine/tyrosine aminotransferase